ncbi:MAG TPA: oxygen-independent coproporphyrinogen III oxidase [Verrucomicrobiota bacterium]|nr:oxygen-independent coproporphyrinogen III oxidase [Verrucomicrobiota bacterium]HRT08716.1 oxygen-independent coproporphyrinogen III oxidase [Candidatus Paceibacterota bacterium]HRT57275.1 oxygen-independent coproporphyrinogen III oxidase [Candidatus Paceibacterota bacterium]
MLTVDLDLVKKYNVAGPRYTSYPPATRFTEALKWADLAGLVLENNRTERDLSLYFHIPFCETLCWYCGCTTVITLNHAQGEAYVRYLDREMAQMSTLLSPRRKAVQLHWGGGSPTFLAPDEIRRLGESIRRHFVFSEDIEAGVEVDPRRLTRDHLVALREIGFNRASIGVQDFDPTVMKAVHREQPRALVEQVLGWVRELGFSSVNFDLIYGLPYQTVESFNRTLDAVVEMGPDRLAVFSYAHVPWVKPAQRILEQKALPGAEVKLQLLKTVIERLTADNRYVYIGMDHFARPTDELAVAQSRKQLQRNFQGYSTRGGADIYAFGMSSISQIPEAYWQNEKDLPKYYAALDAGRVPLARGYRVTEEDKIRRETIMRVMCDLSLNYAAMSQRLGIDFAAHFERELESLAGFEADGLVRRTAEGIEVTGTGRLFIRNIAMSFDNTLAPEGERKHSRTI